MILAGGRGRRMGGADKGLLPYRGRPLIEWTLERLRPQVAELLISANRNPERYARYGLPLLADAMPDFQGPLAGIERALARAACDWVLCVPCDTPQLPADLASRLYSAAQEADAVAAVAHDGVRLQPAWSLFSKTLHAELARYIETGERELGRFIGQTRCVHVINPAWAAASLNFNRPEDLLLSGQ